MDNNYGFGGEGIWLFALLILFGMGGFGGFGANGRWGADGRCATVEDLNAQQNATRLENMVQNNGNLTEMKFDGLTKGLCDGFYSNAMQLNSLEKNLTAQIGALSTKMDAEKIASLQAKVNQLETQNMFCGIPRINPYGYGVYPYNGCGGCGCKGGF